MTTVVLPPERLARWVQNFGDRHGEVDLAVREGRLVGSATDTSSFTAALPFSRDFAGAADLAVFAGACAPPPDWGILLVRKGGFAVARLAGATVTASKVGQRHVQGRTKAGGQSQQRFARRRDNQARVAFEAAAEHAVRLIGDVAVLVVGGDHVAVTAVLEDPRLRVAASRVRGAFLAVPDPRRAVLESAVAEGCSVTMSVINA